MERVLAIALAAAALVGCTTPSPRTPANTTTSQVTNYETPGNLQANAPLGCVPISEVTNKHTPADIYPGMAACIKAADYEKAAPLFAVAGAFGRFDQLRVSDSTARQAITVLQLKYADDLTKEQRENFVRTLQSMLSPGSSQLAVLCSAVEPKGPPDYLPTYMIQHGMGAFSTQTSNGLKYGFDSDKGWKDSLNGYLHCS